MPPLPVNSSSGYEGYGYLGLGAIVVVLAGLVIARQGSFTMHSALRCWRSRRGAISWPCLSPTW